MKCNARAGHSFFGGDESSGWSLLPVSRPASSGTAESRGLWDLAPQGPKKRDATLTTLVPEQRVIKRQRDRYRRLKIIKLSVGRGS